MTRPRPDLPDSHPQNTPLSEWSNGWLVLSVSGHTDVTYMIATAEEKREYGWPVGRQEMIDLLVSKGDVPAAGTYNNEPPER